MATRHTKPHAPNIRGTQSDEIVLIYDAVPSFPHRPFPHPPQIRWEPCITCTYSTFSTILLVCRRIVVGPRMLAAPLLIADTYARTQIQPRLIASMSALEPVRVRVCYMLYLRLCLCAARTFSWASTCFTPFIMFVLSDSTVSRATGVYGH